MTRSLTASYPDTRREHHPAAPRVCELPPRQRPRRLARPSPRRPRTRFLPPGRTKIKWRAQGDSNSRPLAPEINLDVLSRCFSLALRVSCILVLHGIRALLDLTWTQLVGVNP